MNACDEIGVFECENVDIRGEWFGGFERIRNIRWTVEEKPKNAGSVDVIEKCGILEGRIGISVSTVHLIAYKEFSNSKIYTKTFFNV